MPYGLAVDNWSSTVGTAHTAGDGQLVLAALNGLPTLPANRIYRLTACTNPDTPTEVILGVFQSTGRAGLALTGLTAAAGYSDVNLAAGVVVQIRVCKATIDELQAGIESHSPGGTTHDIQFNSAGAFAGGGPVWDGNTFTATNMTTGGMIAQGFSTTGPNAGVTLTNRANGAQVWSIASVSGDYGVFNLVLGAYGIYITANDNSVSVPNTFRTGTGATGSRPTGRTAGDQWYDATLHKPIWWDGSAWRDASGAVV
jgi:hypothetical protein